MLARVLQRAKVSSRVDDNVDSFNKRYENEQENIESVVDYLSDLLAEVCSASLYLDLLAKPQRSMTAEVILMKVMRLSKRWLMSNFATIQLGTTGHGYQSSDRMSLQAEL